MKTSLLHLLPVGLLALTSPLSAGLLVYEPFDYASETQIPDETAGAQETAGLAVADGGTGLKAPRKLQRDRQPFLIAAEGLTYTDVSGKNLLVKGNSVTLPEGNSPIFLIEDMYPAAFERLRSPENAAMLGNPGEVVWFSFLMHATGVTQPSQSFTFKFSGGQSGFSVGMLNNQKSTDPWIRIISVSTKRVMEDGQTYLIVGKATLGPDGEVEVWVNPEIGIDEPGEPASAVIKGSDFSFRELWFTMATNNELKVAFDEIRIGDTFADVAPAAP